MQRPCPFWLTTTLTLLLADAAGCSSAPPSTSTATPLLPPSLSLSPTPRPHDVFLTGVALTVDKILGPTMTESAKGTAAPYDPQSPCPVTKPPDPPFVPPAPYPQRPYSGVAGDFWYGTPSLWTAVPYSGVWAGLPRDLGIYGQKVFWWSQNFSIDAEPQPQLSVEGRRLDAPAPSFNNSRATNAFARDIGTAMLIGVGFPTLGCWEITGRYKGAELSFVVRVAP